MIIKPTKLFTLPTVAIALVIGVALYVTDRKQWTIDKQAFIITAHTQENRLLAAQLSDYSQQIYQTNYEEYRRGYDKGRIDMGISLMAGESMVNYSDGYHAALTQFDPDFVEPMDSTDPVAATFLSLYGEALAAGNKVDARFYLDMLITQLEEEVKLSPTDETDRHLLETQQRVGYEDHTTIELLEQVRDDFKEPARPSVGDAFKPLNKQE
jgi:hypothetical protein